MKEISNNYADYNSASELILNEDNSYYLHNSCEGEFWFCKCMGLLNYDLSKQFPDISVQIYGRIKSQLSNQRKIQKLIEHDDLIKVYDNLGMKIILCGIDGNKSITNIASDEDRKLEDRNEEKIKEVINYIASNQSILAKLGFKTIQKRTKYYCKDNGYKCSQISLAKGDLIIEIHGRTKYRDIVASSNHSEYKENYYNVTDLAKILPDEIKVISNYCDYKNFMKKVPKYYFVKFDGSVWRCSDYVNILQFFKNAISDDAFFKCIEEKVISTSNVQIDYIEHKKYEII